MARIQIRGNTQIKDASIGNAQIATDAAIAYSKLDLAGQIGNADIATDAAVAVSKLEVLADKNIVIGNGTTNQKVAVSGDITLGNDGVAAIASGVIVDTDVATDASIGESKIDFDPTSGHKHDGTDSHTISYNDLTDKPSGLVGNFDVSRETPSGTINGTNTAFTLASTPTTGSEHVFLNGLLQEDGTDADYTISGNVITMVDAPSSGDKLIVSYGVD